MRRPLLSVACAGLALCAAACRPSPSPPARRSPQVLTQMPKVPGSLPVDTVGTEEVERWTADVIATPDSVANFFRARFAEAGGRIMNDLRDAPRYTVDLYADFGDTVTVWLHVQIQRLLVSRYTLVASRREEPAAGTPAP